MGRLDWPALRSRTILGEPLRLRIIDPVLMVVAGGLLLQRAVYHQRYLGDVPFAVAAVGESADQIRQASEPDTLYQHFLALTLRLWPNIAMPVVAQLLLVWLTLALGGIWVWSRWGSRTALVAAIVFLVDPTLTFYENKPLPVVLTVLSCGWAAWSVFRFADARSPTRLFTMFAGLAIAAVGALELSRGPLGGPQALPEPIGERAFLRGLDLVGVFTLSHALGPWQPPERAEPSAWHVFRLGEAEEQVGSFARALSHYERAIWMDPHEPRFLVAHARLLYFLLRIHDAEAALDRAHPLLPAEGPLRGEADAVRGEVVRILARWEREGRSRGPWRVVE